MTSLSISGPVRFPLGLRLKRRDVALPRWAAHVTRHVPDLRIPTEKTARNCLHQQVDPVLLQEPVCRARHEQFRPKMALAIDLVEEAIGRKVP